MIRFAPTSLRLRDPAAFAEAFQQHAPAALATALAVLRDRHAAEDVVQDVFATLWAKPDAFQSERGSLGTYVRLMARSRALDRVRANAVASTATARLAGQAVVADAAAETAERREVLRAIGRALDALPPAQRTAVVLHHLRGVSDRELADIAGVPVGTAKSRIRLGTGRIQRAGLAAA